MTNEQKQCLLKYLGYYSGKVDGISGKRSREATTEFQKGFGGIKVDGIAGEETEKALRHAVCYGMPTREETEPDTGTELWWEEIKHFSRDEFACPCPRCGGFPAEPKKKLVMLADDVREHFGSPADVSSGVRCQAHNDELPGSVPNSRHRDGKAMDFRIRGKSATTTLNYVKTLPGVRYAYAIDSEYVHMDIE